MYFTFLRMYYTTTIKKATQPEMQCGQCGLVYTYMRTNQCNQYVEMQAYICVPINVINMCQVYTTIKSYSPEMQAYICVPITVINMCQVYTRIALPVDEYAIDVSQVHKRVHVCLQPCDWIKYKWIRSLICVQLYVYVCICMYTTL